VEGVPPEFWLVDVAKDGRARRRGENFIFFGEDGEEVERGIR